MKREYSRCFLIALTSLFFQVGLHSKNVFVITIITMVAKILHTLVVV
jgi:hypothetical protein